MLGSYRTPRGTHCGTAELGRITATNVGNTERGNKTGGREGQERVQDITGAQKGLVRRFTDRLTPQGCCPSPSREKALRIEEDLARIS